MPVCWGGIEKEVYVVALVHAILYDGTIGSTLYFDYRNEQYPLREAPTLAVGEMQYVSRPRDRRDHGTRPILHDIGTNSH